MHGHRTVCIHVNFLPAFELLFFLGQIDCFHLQVFYWPILTYQTFLEVGELGSLLGGHVPVMNNNELVGVGSPALEGVAEDGNLAG